MVNISKKAGMSPGSLVHVGDVFSEEAKITIIDYCKDTYEEHTVQSIEEIIPYRKKGTVTWVNVEGLKNIAHIDAVGQIFKIHSLVLEDILNTHQRPKIEEYDDYLYIVLKMLSLEDDGFSVAYEQVSILLLDNFILTFKEKKDDVFLPIISRIKNGKGRLRNMGPDYLTYRIMDTIVDMNFFLLDSLDEIVDGVEDELLANPTRETLVTIQRTKRELINIRRSILPLRELLASILRSETELINEKTYVFFRDIYDHVIHITEAIESYRDILSGLLDIYISSVSNKMNEVMKVLTIFASIFIPLTFITGIYGMNFDYIPELQWKWAYAVLWVLFIGIALVLLIYFKKKKWL